MKFQDIPVGTDVFIDANPFIYYFGPDPRLGPDCERLLERIENQEIRGFTSAQVLSDVAHRLMTLEARAVFKWPMAGIVKKLRSHPSDVRRLSRYRQAIDEIALVGVQVVPVTGGLVSLAADVSTHTGLLSSDALIVAIMRHHGIAHLASRDADFDSVSGITRYSPA